MKLRLQHKVTKHLRTVLFAALMSICTTVVGQTAQSAQTIDSLKIELTKAKTAADSVVVLHNLYDCYYLDERTPILYQIFETAKRAKDYRSMLETLFLLAAMNKSDPEMETMLIEMAKNNVPESDLQKATILYIKLRFQSVRLNQATEAERQQKLLQALKDYRTHNMLDKFDRIGCLFLICTNLRNSTDSKLLLSYLQQLQDLVEDLPQEELTLRSQFYSLAINVYTENEMYDKVLAANKRMREVVGEFDKFHESQGRIFRNYDGSLYNICYYMLVCAQELPAHEIDSYYAQSLEIATRNPRIHSDIAWQTATRIYYLMAKKRYAEALQLLKRKLKEEKEITGKHYHFGTLLIKAAEATGDKEALLMGSKVINSIYRDRLKAKPDVSLSELQTIYDVDNLKGRNRDLNIENRRLEIDRRRQGFIAVTIAVVIVICILIWLLGLYIHSRRLANRLSSSNKRLVDERNSHAEIYAHLVKLRDKAKVADDTKSNFVQNMSSDIKEPLNAIVEYSHLLADYAKDDERKYIREYSDALSVNTDLLIRLVNDILDVPELESGELSIQRSHSSVNEICNFALEVIKKHVAPGVEIIFTNQDQPDSLIFTDPQRVEQVLIQILTNAAKFTDFGSITFGYDINKFNNTITFTVADTGIGIRSGMEEKIFSRFVKMDPTSQGSGLGLYISRLLADMLGGTLTLDTEYTDGARFIFTIPIN